jgi:hypothetical protein
MIRDENTLCANLLEHYKHRNFFVEISVLDAQEIITALEQRMIFLQNQNANKRYIYQILKLKKKFDQQK